MKRILRAKFSSQEDLKELLLSTGDRRLVEVASVDSPVNRLWGEVNGKGKNMLGVLLMEVREELRAEAVAIKPRKRRASAPTVSRKMASAATP